MLPPITLTVPGTVDVLSAARPILAISQEGGLAVQLDASASANDGVALYGGAISTATSVAQLQILAEIGIPGPSGDGRKPVFGVPPTPFPFIYAVRTSIGTSGPLDLSISGQETSGTALPLPLSPSMIVGGTGGAISLVYTPSAPTPLGNLFNNWASLVAFVSSLPFGSAPVITFTESCVIPLAGMPVGGWQMHEATWKSYTAVTGSVTVDIPDGVIISCQATFSIGYGLRVITNATSEYGVFQYTASPAIFGVGQGADFIPLGTSAPLVTPGSIGQSYIVVAMDFPSLNVGGPPATAPWVSLHGTDVCIAAQQSGAGPLPNGWVIGPASAFLEYLDGLNATHPLIFPGFSGTITIANNNSAVNLPYAPAVLADWSGTSPQNVKVALDRIAAHVGPIP